MNGMTMGLVGCGTLLLYVHVQILRELYNMCENSGERNIERKECSEFEQEKIIYMSGHPYVYSGIGQKNKPMLHIDAEQIEIVWQTKNRISCRLTVVL